MYIHTQKLLMCIYVNTMYSKYKESGLHSLAKKRIYRVSGDLHVFSLISHIWELVLFVCFVALSPKSTAMVMVGRSVHLTTLFPGQAWTSSLPVLREHTFACNWQQPILNDSAVGRITAVEIILWSISTKVWNRTGTPRSAVRLAFLPDTLLTALRCL